jgi:hypothetical protein
MVAAASTNVAATSFSRLRATQHVTASLLVNLRQHKQADLYRSLEPRCIRLAYLRTHESCVSAATRVIEG